MISILMVNVIRQSSGLTQAKVFEGRSTWEPNYKQETSFRGMSQRMKVIKEHIEGLYRELSKETGDTHEAFHFDNFELRDGNYARKSRAHLGS